MSLKCPQQDVIPVFFFQPRWLFQMMEEYWVLWSWVSWMYRTFIAQKPFIEIIFLRMIFRWTEGSCLSIVFFFFSFKKTQIHPLLYISEGDIVLNYIKLLGYIIIMLIKHNVLLKISDSFDHLQESRTQFGPELVKLHNISQKKQTSEKSPKRQCRFVSHNFVLLLALIISQIYLVTLRKEPNPQVWEPYIRQLKQASTWPVSTAKCCLYNNASVLNT